MGTRSSRSHANSNATTDADVHDRDTGWGREPGHEHERDDEHEDGRDRGRPEPLSLAILGVGSVGRVHLRSARSIEDVTVAAVADRYPENRRRAVRDGVDRTYDDYATLLESEAETIDAAVVALPPDRHRDAVEAAATVGVDVFVEKPLAESVAAADAMLEVAAENEIRVGVDHTLRYQPDIRRLKAAYDEGRIGRVPYASMRRLNDGLLGKPPATDAPKRWMLDSEAGSALFDLGIHCFDVLEWFFGDLEIEAASTDRTLELPVDDAATVLLRAPESGTTVTLHCGTYQWESLPDVNTRLRLEGIAGTLENETYQPSSFAANAARSAATNVLRRVAGDEPDVFGPTFYLRAHARALRAFVDAIRAGERPPVSGRDGRRCLALAESATELAESGETGGSRLPAEPNPGGRP